MAKKSGLQVAIEQVEAEIAVSQLLLARLKDALKAGGPKRTRKPKADEKAATS